MTPFTSISTPNLYLHIPNATASTTPTPATAATPDSRDSRNSKERYLIFFITGNPGLVGYYTPFFRELIGFQGLEENVGGRVAVFAGNLAGFEVGGGGGGGEAEDEKFEGELLYPAAVKGIKAKRDRREVVGLGEQVEVCIARLGEVVRRLRLSRGMGGASRGQVGQEHSLAHGSKDEAEGGDNADGEREGTRTGDGGKSEVESSQREGNEEPVKVILIGHSVGAYIALEMIQKLNKCESHHLSLSHYPTSKPGTMSAPFKIISAILLTPTILDLALSPTGRMAGPIMGSMLGSFVPGVAQWGAWGLGYMGKERMRGLIGLVTGMGRKKGGESAKESDGSREEEDKEGMNGLDVTTQFLASPNGVRQALGLAAEELKMIAEDRWGEEVWGGAGEEGTSPKLFFLFAGSDHWVAHETREKIMQKTSQLGMGKRHVVEVDEELEHAWCLRQSGKVGDKVGGWIDGIIKHGT
jgi:hypothetical protein